MINMHKVNLYVILKKKFVENTMIMNIAMVIMDMKEVFFNSAIKCRRFRFYNKELKLKTDKNFFLKKK